MVNTIITEKFTEKCSRVLRGTVSLILLLLFAAPTLAGDSSAWKKVAWDGQYEYLVNSGQVEREGDQVSFWMKSRSKGSGPGYRSVNYRLFCDTFEYSEEGSLVSVGSRELRKSSDDAEKHRVDKGPAMEQCFDAFCGDKVTSRYPGGSRRGEGWVYTRSPEGKGEKIKVGPWTYWFPGGGKSEEIFFRGGRKHGAWTTWDRQGRKLKEENYLNGIPHGLWTSWHPNGKKKSESNYLLGKLEGKAVTWNPKGKVIEEKWYSAGEEVDPPAGR